MTMELGINMTIYTDAVCPKLETWMSFLAHGLQFDPIERTVPVIVVVNN